MKISPESDETGDISHLREKGYKLKKLKTYGLTHSANIAGPF